MATLADAYVRLRADDRKLGPEVKDKAGRHGKVFGGAFVRASAGPLKGFGGILNRSIGGVVAGLGAVAGAAAIASFVKTGVESLGRIERINQQTATAIKSTGGAARVTAKHVEDLAGNLENLTATEAETTQEGANLLLTFTNIRNAAGKGNDVFDQTVKVMTDMSRALGQDTKSSAIQLGKALNDPIKGVSALQRVGVSFTAKQKEQIKTLVESGKTMDAQKLILRELNTEFGGSAEAFAKTTEGRVELAKHAFGTLQETITAGLLPVLGKMAQFFLDRVVPAAEKLIALFQRRALPRLKEFAGFVRDEVVPRVVDLAGNLRDALAPTVERIAGFFRDKLLPALKAVGEFIVTKALPAVSGLFGWLADHQDVVKSIAIAIAALLVPAFISWAVAAGAAAVSTIAAAAPVILVTAVVAGLVFGIIQLVKHWDTIWGHIWSFMKTIGGWFAGPFVDFFKVKVFGWLKSNWPLLLGIIGGPFGLAVGLVIKYWRQIRDGLVAGWNFIRDKVFSPISNFVTKTIPNAFRTGVGTVVGWWDGLRQKLATPINFVINTIINKGIIDSINWVAKHVGVKARIPHVPGINVPLTGSSPSRSDRISGNVRGDGPGIGGRGDGFGDLLKVFTSPAKWLTGRVGLGGITRRFGNNPFSQVLSGAGNKVKDFAIEKIKDLLGFFDFGGGGGAGGLAAGISAVLASLRGTFGAVSVISGLRRGARTLSGNVSYHASGRAIDIAPVLAWAQFLSATWGSRLRELITPWNGLNILNGRPHRYTGAVWNQHNFAGGNAHIHAALDDGGLRWLRPGLNIIPNGTGRLEPIAGPRAMGGTTYNVNVYPSPLAHPADVGKEVVKAIQAFERNNGARWRT